MNFIKANAGHIIGAVFFVFFCIGLYSYVQEHDARIRAEDAVKTAETSVTALHANAVTTATTAARAVEVVQRQAAVVTTVPEAVAALPAVAPELHAEPLDKPLADAPVKVAVDALPLFQDLATCRESTIRLNACTTELDDSTKIETAKDAEIKVLKSKGSFWSRVKTTAEMVGIGVAIGYAAKH